MILQYVATKTLGEKLVSAKKISECESIKTSIARCDNMIK